MKQTITFQNLTVAPYEVEQLLDVQLEHGINRHSTCYFKALLPEGKKDSYVTRCTQGSELSLLVVNSGEENILFRGMVQDVEIKAVQGSYYMEVSAVSYSYLLDIDKKKRTFQNKKISYEELIQQVVADCRNAMIHDVVTQEEKTKQLLVQYEETNWEFLKRLASHFHTGLVNDVHVDYPRLYFGVPHRGKHKIETFHYRVKQDMGKYLKWSKSGMKGLQEQDFVYYQVETKVPVNIGDEVQFQGQTLYVYQVKAYMEKGEFLFQLTLTTENGMSQLYQCHEKIVGASLSTRVTDIQNDRVKVSLEIDEICGHFPGEPCFFPYSTIYSSQDGSGWYCMPEQGDQVRIYFPDGVEEHSYAISSVHEEVDPAMLSAAGAKEANSDSNTSEGVVYSGQRDNPNIKSLRNQNGKEIRLAPEGIYIITDSATIMLTDEGGISIVSDQNIEFKSDKSIHISAEQDVNIVGLTGVDLSCNETASIKIEENVEVIGQEVKAN